MSVDTIITMSELKKVASEISERANMSLVYDKHNYIKQGVNKLKEDYQDVYTVQALNDVIAEYKVTEYDKHTQELEKFDSYSDSLLNKATILSERLESNLLSAADPTTKYELEQHNYLVDKLKNNLFASFTGSNPSMDEINSILNQAASNKGYARALTHLHAMLINNIENNANIEQTTKQQLRSTVNDKMEEFKQDLLPFEYKELQNIKMNLERNSSAVRGQKHRFEMLNDMYEGKSMDKYKMPTSGLY
ncbi:hypothetical protein [Staphylococcus equorum]|uniref:hypothetical protein n=1 Tax=Staphylococcus equorum TaxID=246432 RepID=UPI003CEA886A